MMTRKEWLAEQIKEAQERINQHEAYACHFERWVKAFLDYQDHRKRENLKVIARYEVESKRMAAYQAHRAHLLAARRKLEEVYARYKKGG